MTAHEPPVVDDPDAVVCTLIGLAELGLRVHWVEDRLRRWDVAHAARVLQSICEGAERSHPPSTEAVIPIVLAFARLGETPQRAELRRIARADKLLSLERLLREAPKIASSPSDAARPLRREQTVSEPSDDLPVPDYGRGRELTVGERRSLARRPSRHQLEKLLLNPHPLVIEQLLENPRVTEDDILRLSTKRPARLAALRVLSRSVRFMSRPRVRLSLVLNPGCPADIATPLVLTCRHDELGIVIRTTTVSATIRAVARELRDLRGGQAQGSWGQARGPAPTTGILH